MTERFYRPFLGKEIETYVRSCDTCQKVKSSGNPNRAELNIILPQRTNEMVVTDMAGPFKTTVRGNNYLQIIADSFSKYLVCRPTRNKASMTVATNLLENWCWTFGIPEKFLSDKGKEFRSRVLEDLCSLLDIQRLNTTPGHPQCDGQSEKNVQQVKKMIRAHVADDQENWDMGLPQLCFAYNSSIHETTGCSPFEVMFGREPIVPIDLIYPNRLEHTREKITESKRTQLSKSTT